jgi:hypothetical protein
MLYLLHIMLLEGNYLAYIHNGEPFLQESGFGKLLNNNRLLSVNWLPHSQQLPSLEMYLIINLSNEEAMVITRDCGPHPLLI